MTQKHSPTPTPWHLVTQSPDDEGIVRTAVRVPGPQPTDTEYGICTIDGHGSMEHDAREVADAELIVRAVNAHDALVEALERAAADASSIGIIVGMVLSSQGAAITGRIRESIDRIDAALRAAKGEK